MKRVQLILKSGAMVSADAPSDSFAAEINAAWKGWLEKGTPRVFALVDNTGCILISELAAWVAE